MLLLTWHGTILRVEQAHSRLSHAPLIPVREAARDFAIDVPHPVTQPVLIGAGMELLPAAGERAGMLHLRRDGKYLRVDPDAPFPLCELEQPAADSALMTLSEAEAACLRRLLDGHWAFAATGRPVRPGGIAVGPGFQLSVEGELVDLARTWPVVRPDGEIHVSLPGGAVALAPLPSAAKAPEWHLRPFAAPPDDQPSTLHAVPYSRLQLPGILERCFEPLTASRADSDFLYGNFRGTTPPFASRQSFDSAVVREEAVCVLLEGGLMGTVCGPHGVTTPFAPPAQLPAYLAREAEAVFFDTAVLGATPALAGPHAVICAGTAAENAHPVIDAMLRLSMLAPHLPAATTLILPPSMIGAGCRARYGFDMAEGLQAFGFDTMPFVSPLGPAVLVEQVYWASSAALFQLCGAALAAARQRATRHIKPPAKPRRIFLHDAGQAAPANSEAVRETLSQNGFETLDPTALTLPDLIQAMHQASFVAVASAAARGCTLFCEPGTKILEFVTGAAFDPSLSMLSDKLGLPHGVLPCRPSASGAHHADIAHLGALLRIMLGRL
jgi:hypothetical protein